MTEKRKFQRIPFQCYSQIKCGDRTYTAELLDISMKGALLLARDMTERDVGHICFLDITLANSDIHLHFEAELTHKAENHYGFVFLGEDLETFMHLRRLLELNIGDDEIIERELIDLTKS